MGSVGRSQVVWWMGTHGTAHALNQSLNEDLREDWTCSTELSSLNKFIIIITIYINAVSVCTVKGVTCSGYEKVTSLSAFLVEIHVSFLSYFPLWT